MQNQAANPMMFIQNPYTEVCRSYGRVYFEEEITRVYKWRLVLHDVLYDFLVVFWLKTIHHWSPHSLSNLLNMTPL